MKGVRKLQEKLLLLAKSEINEAQIKTRGKEVGESREEGCP